MSGRPVMCLMVRLIFITLLTRLDMSFMGCPQSVALSGLPGCRFRNIHQNLSMDLSKCSQASALSNLSN